MFYYRLDSYQKGGLDALDEHKIVFVHGEKQSGKSYLLRELAVKYVYQGKLVLMVVKDDQHAEIMFRHMNQYQLNPYCLLIRSLSELTPEELARLRSSVKTEQTRFSKENLSIEQNKYAKLIGRIESYYDKINTKTLFGKSWHELVVLNAFSTQTIETLHFNQIIQNRKFTFDQDEYDELLEKLVEAHDFYTQGNAHTSVFFDRYVYDEYKDAVKAWKSIAKWVSGIKKKTVNIILSISLFLQSRQNTSEKEFMVVSSAVRKELDKILLDIELFDLKYEKGDELAGGIFNISKAKKLKARQFQKDRSEILRQYVSLIGKINDIPGFYKYFEKRQFDIDEQDLQIVEQNLHVLHDDFKAINTYLATYVKKELKTININNSKDPSLLKIEQDIVELYNTLEEQKFVVKKFENNAFSINKQLAQLEKLVEEMNDIQSMVNRFHQYYEWNLFYHNLSDKQAYLIGKFLILQPKNWIQFYRNWYVQNVISKDRDPFLLDVKQELDSIHQNRNEIMALALRNHEKLRALQKAELLDKLKNLDKTLYKTLLRKSTYEALNWELFLSNHGALISALYPILIIPQRLMESLASKVSIRWDILLFDQAGTADEAFLPIKKACNKLAHQWVLTSDDTERNIKDLIHGMAFFKEESYDIVHLQGYHQQNVIRLAEMSHTERLYAARNIAHLLQNTNRNIKVFQLENYIIFSCLTAMLNTILLKLLEHRGVKEMRVLESPYHLLVENILEVNATQILMTQDYLINNRVYDNVPWQLHVEEMVQKAGINLIDLQTSSLLDNPIAKMSALIDIHFP